MTKKEKHQAQRIRIWNKYDNKCAYCGDPIELKQMQKDHVNPIYRGSSDEELERMGIVRGLDEESNLAPSCKRCNLSKDTYTLENFRKEIELKVIRLKKVSNYKMALDFGLVQEMDIKVVFYFEKFD